MPGELNLTVVIAFIGSVGVLIGTGLFVLTVILRIQQKHRKRLARVGRKRLTGQFDLEEARLLLLKHKKDSNALVAVTEALSRFLPILDTTRLRANMIRAGLGLSVGAFILLSVLIGGAIAFGASLALGYPLALVLVPGLFGGMLVMDAFVRMRGDMKSNRFMKQLPDALDTIIRGIRSGLPVIECIGNVGKEFDAPVGDHFRAVSERVMLGESLGSALWRVAGVVRKPEMDFLAISITIQMETGGSLAEALGNLADLLRQRQRMKLKIRAISSEAKASAMIIGALPFMMLGLLALMSPGYVSPLFSDPRGQMMLLAGLGSISVGAFIMWRMTQFEI